MKYLPPHVAAIFFYFFFTIFCRFLQKGSFNFFFSFFMTLFQTRFNSVLHRISGIIIMMMMIIIIIIILAGGRGGGRGKEKKQQLRSAHFLALPCLLAANSKQNKREGQEKNPLIPMVHHCQVKNPEIN